MHDTIDIELNLIDIVTEDYEGNKINSKQIHTFLSINNKIINFHTDYDSFLLYSKDCRSWYEKENNIQKQIYSDFYPFNCTCGIGGCAGLWNGIFTKYRKKSVEWRLKKEDGYGFLDKTFYSFDRNQYDQVVNKIYNFLLTNKEEYIIINGYGDPEPISALLDFWNKEKLINF